MHDSLSPAQKEAVFHKEGALLILAGAGAGKTRVITHRIAELIRSGVSPEHILAVTFTNKATQEMKERTGILLGREWTLSPYDTPKTLPFIGTFHALSIHIIRAFHQKAGLPKSFTIFDRSDSTRALKKAIAEVGFDPKELEPRRVLSVMGRAKGDALSVEDFRNERSSSYIDEAIADVWEKYETILKKEKALDFDDILLVAYTLLKKHPDVLEHFQSAWDYIHVDEYQDTNRVQYEIVRMLAMRHGNIAVVGDADQCLVKGTRVTMANGAYRPIEKIRKGDLLLSNYGGGDMRPATVLAVRTRMHNKHLIRITTESGTSLTSTPDHIHFADYRLGIAPQYYFTYLMHKTGTGWRIGVSQVYTRGQRDKKVGFKQRCLQEGADAVWIVGVFKTMQDARINEYMLSLRYGLPTLPFVARKGASKNGYVHDQVALDAIFHAFDTDASAKKLLRDKDLSLAHPHHRAQSVTGVRRVVTLTLCGDRRGARPMHRVSIVGSDKESADALRALGFSVRPAKYGSRSWRFETVRADYAEAQQIVEQIERALPGTYLLENARLGGKKKLLREYNSLRFMPAASLFPGMALFTENGGYDVVKTIERVEMVKPVIVYDIDVEHTHNFIANGIATHNCIYSWRGASLDHILNFEHDFKGAKIVMLTENYRSTKIIIQVANDAIVKNIRRQEKELFTKNADGEPIAVIGCVNENHEATCVVSECRNLIRGGTSPNDIAVLYRANFQSRALEEAFLRSGIPYQVLGTRFFERKEIKDALSYLRLAQNPESASDLARIMNTPPRGIGKVTLAKAIGGQTDELSAAQKQKVNDFYAVIDAIRTKVRTAKPSECVRFVLEKSGMREAYARGKGEDEERLENLEELVTVATKYDSFPPEEGIERLIEEAALQSDQDELMRGREKKNGVKLMTVHAAKGLEFPYVFVTGLEDGLFPHESDGGERHDDEEERRLFYVALTRAKKKVFLTYTASRRIFGTRVMNLPSEFITEMDPTLYEVNEDGTAGRSPDEDVIV